MPLSETNRLILFRIGSLSKALVYVLMGLFCLGTVVGIVSSTGGPVETIRWLGQNPYGQLLYFLLGLGLGAYSLWRIYKTIFDPQDEGWAGRLTSLSVAVAYGGLSLYALRRLFGSGDEDDVRKDLLQLLLGWSYGVVIVYGIAVGVIVAGVSALRLGVINRHVKDIPTWNLRSWQIALFSNVGRVGLLGVAIVYFIMAYSLFRVAYFRNGEAFKGVGESLAYLETGNLGWWLLIVTGVGLLAYGVFMGLRAAYEKV